ncbi:MAG: alanine/ornithine racemase family PLP-dependent enzyme [Nitrospiraceae bacterium]|nr:alanine/ornithine racemase family PLP-dependent enzyme [Nitrospiraceae bacterium]
MGAPRLEIDLDKIGHNVRSLCTLFATKGICITAVTKAVLGDPLVAKVLVDNGIKAIGDSRIANIHKMKEAGIETEFTLIRSPMPSETEEVVQYADISLNTETAVIKLLSRYAAKHGKRHQVILMVELGDLREGIMPSELGSAIAETLAMEGVELVGLGTNLACYAGVNPTPENMAELCDIATRLRSEYDIPLEIISGGNSANYEWFVSTADLGQVNNVRIGEAILLGRETLRRERIPGLYTDAFTLVAEVIERKTKPSFPVGPRSQDAFGDMFEFEDKGSVSKAILGIGRQDVDPSGITPRIAVECLGASSDHLILDAKDTGIVVGSEVTFDVDYSALLRAMTSPYVAKEFLGHP